MPERVVSTLLDGYGFFEGPHWRADRHLWLVDKVHFAVYAVTSRGEVETVVSGLDTPPNGISWLPDGRLLMGMESRVILRHEHDGSIVTHADLRSTTPMGVISDIITDWAGRTYVGHTGFDIRGSKEVRPSTIVRVDPDGSTSVVAEDVYMPNNMSMRVGGRTIVSSETMAQRLTLFDIGADGSLGNRREWARFGPLIGTDELVAALEARPDARTALVPDGNTSDAEGAIWVADVGPNSRLARVLEGGEIVDEIVVDGLKLYACELGGEDGHTLFICAAPMWENGVRTAGKGKLLACRVDVPAAR